MTKVSVHRLYKKYKDENLTQEQFRQLLIDNGVIIPKEKMDDYTGELERQHNKADRILKRMQKKQ